MSQNNSQVLHLGCDVAKASLAFDPALLPKLRLVGNDAKGHQQFLKALLALAAKEGRTPHVILEATGGYEQAVVKALHAAGVRVSVVMPKRVHHHAQSRGVQAKTDPIDAGKLSAFGRDVQPAPTPPLTATEEELRELSRRRRQLVRLRNQETNRQEISLGKVVTRSVKSVVSHLAKEIKTIDHALAALRRKDAVYDAKMTVLCAIQGVGETTAAATLAALPELGTTSRQGIASLAGLAPKNRDSGTKKGRAFIIGGRVEARCALYMAAVSAARCNHVLRPYYQRLIAAGKPAKLALTAVMRRLLIHMNSQVKTLLQPAQTTADLPVLLAA
jgi:transposase